MEQVSTKKVSRKRTRPFKLTERDIKILRLIGENRFSTAHDIQKRYWHSKDTVNHHRRLRILQKNAFLERLVGDKGITLGYKLGRKGRLLAQQLGVNITELKRQPSYRTSFDHDEKLARIRDTLEKSPLVLEYQPEHLVRIMLAKRYGKEEKRDSGYKVPDALFKLKTVQRTFSVALELECSRKTYSRYRHFLSELATSKDADLVFIVCEDSKTLLILRTLLTEVREKNPFVKVSKRDNGFYFILLENLLNHELNAIFDGDGWRFSLNSLAKALQEK